MLFCKPHEDQNKGFVMYYKPLPVLIMLIFFKVKNCYKYCKKNFTQMDLNLRPLSSVAEPEPI